jgi:hypothetical protein
MLLRWEYQSLNGKGLSRDDLRDGLGLQKDT